MKTLYIHIGTPKTATTSIQSFCVENKELLDSNNYFYPMNFESYSGINPRRNGHFLIASYYDENGNFDSSTSNQKLEENLKTLVSFFDLHDNIILSDESIWRSAYKKKKNLFPRLVELGKQHNFTVKIIVYLRRQDGFVSSRWNQFVKYIPAEKLSFEEHLQEVEKNEGYILNYGKTLKKFAEILGRENIIVRRFDKKFWVNESIILDFISAIGMNIPESYNLPEYIKNPRLEGNAIEFKRIINNIPGLDMSQLGYMSDILVGISEASGPSYESSVFSYEENVAFLEKYKKGNEYVAKEFINDGYPLFNYDVKELPKWSPDNEYWNTDIVEFITNVALTLHQENTALKERLSVLEKRVSSVESSTLNNTQRIANIRHPFKAVVKKTFRRH